MLMNVNVFCKLFITCCLGLYSFMQFMFLNGKGTFVFFPVCLLFRELEIPNEGDLLPVL